MTTLAPAPEAPLPTRYSPLLRHARQRATGALRFAAGTLYLADGGVVHAESPAAPGVDVLLTAGDRMPRADWDRLLTRAGPRRPLARLLVDSGRVSRGELEVCLLTAVLDAAFFALAPSTEPPSFRAGAAPAIRVPNPLPAARVEEETRRRRHLLDDLAPDLSGGTAQPLRRPSPPGTVVPPRRHALLELADGTRTPAQLARLLGRPAFHVLLDLHRLAHAGLVDLPAPPPPAARQPEAASPATVARQPEALPPLAVRRSPESVPPPAVPRSPEAPPAPPASLSPAPEQPSSGMAFAPPDTDLLLRLRSALQAL
ncbi:transcriptional regulator [Actinomycetota bacterium Odt1-20B]